MSKTCAESVGDTKYEPEAATILFMFSVYVNGCDHGSSTRLLDCHSGCIPSMTDTLEQNCKGGAQVGYVEQWLILMTAFGDQVGGSDVQFSILVGNASILPL